MNTTQPHDGQLYYRATDLTSAPNRKGLLPISQTTLWRWVKDGNFPKPVKLGPSVTAWSSRSIQTWLESNGGQHV